MYSNPQSAFPLPPKPNVERYKKIAKDLLHACKAAKAGDDKAIGNWAESWIETLARLHARGKDLTPLRREINRKIDELERVVTRRMVNEKERCQLADAQFIIARAHGFESWSTLTRHIAAVTNRDSAVTRFESAADAIVEGNLGKLRRLLKQDPGLIRRRSTRQHAATLLHYTSANGVEGYRQQTPPNIVEIAEFLLDAGAEVDAEADVYGGGATTLGLVGTSIHPYKAGVQNTLMQVLLDRGAAIDHPKSAGNESSAVLGCLANGRGEAAVYLAERGARLSLEAAAGVGRLDVVERAFTKSGKLKRGVTKKQIEAALSYASSWGRLNVVKFLVQKGVSLKSHGGDGQTPLHCAAICGQLDTIKYLLKLRPELESKNIYGGTVLGQTLWSAGHGGDPKLYAEIIETLIAAGAKVPERHVPVNSEIDELLRRYGSVPEPTWYWFGEKPRS
jgi:hypothetical protein